MRLIVLFSMVSILGSCSQPRYIYNPPARNLHYFSTKGEAVISASWSTGPSRNDDEKNENYNHGGDLQAAYAFGKHWAILASFYGRKEQDRISDYFNTVRTFSEVRYERTGWELGGSFFHAIDQRRVSFFYIDGGFGTTGNTLNDKSYIDSVDVHRYFNNRSTRFFIQPGVYTGNKVIRFNMGIRFQYSLFSRQETSYTLPELERLFLAGLNDITTYEPFLGIRIGTPELPWIKADLQFAAASINKGFDIRNSYATVGLSIYPFAHK